MSDTERGSGATAARRARPFAASTLALAFAVALAPAPAERAATGTQPAVDGEAERASIETWRAERIRRLTSDTGWLTLSGLFWLKEGENSFGRSSSNAVVLDNPSLADTAGSFVLHDHRVRLVARPGGGVTHDGHAVGSLDLVADTQGEPTVLASGSLRFFIIERAGNLGVRVRDLDNPHRRNFRGFSYFPVSTDWVFDARFEPYEPAHRLKIVNILGMEEDAVSPGAVLFTRDGREWRLDTVLESPADQELFIMFADETSGRETYGAGRFLYIPLPKGGRAPLDFNKAYNPPCALNDFATCPLPPPQNRLKLRVEAGEKKYAGGPGHHS
ncbi:MAG: DUF1684 domain-containing protein [Gammaproteobacteria bacterium]|nr:MAG: DUF1684 domain-containing protein [Gammaproteobacteria bacterium]TLZ06743.1 MAG: DUF1684 domain-containing protein [Gammaproteobacteria bacterium]